MTTPAEAMAVIAVVQACHPRSAPRMDDLEAMKVMATVWAELFSAHQLHPDELVAAVKSRAALLSDAPEPADIIRVARSKRQDLAMRGEQPALDPAGYEPRAAVHQIPDAHERSHLPNPTARLIAAQDQLGLCQGRDESRAAVREYQAALAEYRGKPLTVAEAPLLPDTCQTPADTAAATVATLVPALVTPDPSEPRHPQDDYGDW